MRTSQRRALIVAGDLNDGPGLDDYERLFGRSGVEIVMGGPAGTALRSPCRDRALQSRIAAQPTTARFFIAHEERWLAALLDYIMVSPPCAPRRGAGASGIRSTTRLCWSDTELRDALLDASDHFPVTLDLADRTEGPFCARAQCLS
jgi:endonuclease/exonuclease/phosphatase family metal-dependent hydrolase